MTRSEEGGVRRLDMLETVGQYAREQLAERTDASEVARRHAEHFLARAEDAAPDLQLRAPVELVRALDRELANLRAAMRWMLDHDRPEDCLRVAVALSIYWYKTGTDEGVRWLRAGLNAAGERLPARVHVKALNALALQLAEARTGPECEATSRHALDLARQTGDASATSVALVNLAFALIVQNREPDAYPIAAEAVALAGTTSDPRLLADAHVAAASCAPDTETAVASARRAAEHFERTGNTGRLTDLYCNLTYLSLVQGDDNAALDYVERAEILAERAGTDTDRAYVLGNEGLVRLVTGDVPGAERAFRAELRLARRQSAAAALGESLYGLAAVHAAHGEPDLAARLQGAAGTFTHDHVHPAIRQRLDTLFFASERQRIGERRWERLVAAGRQLNAHEVVALAEGAPLRSGADDVPNATADP